jgi:YVTN family beta-propeller protein
VAVMRLREAGRFAGLTKLLWLRWPERLGPDVGAIASAGFSRARGSPSHLFIINAQFPTITADIRLKGESKAVDVAISPDGRKAYVTNFGSKTVSVVSTATQTVIGTLGVGPSPIGVTVSPNGKELWVANSGGAPSFNNGTVSVFSTATIKPIALTNVGGSPHKWCSRRWAI